MNIKPFLICSILVFALTLTISTAQAQAISVRNEPNVPLTSKDEIISKYAQLLGVPKDSIKNVKLYTLIEQYSPASYKFGGNDPAGVDCSGFSCIIEKQIYGVIIPRSTGLQSAAAKTKSVSELKEGDLVFLKLGGTQVNHVGVYLQNGYFIHATSNMGLVLDNIADPNTQERFMACGSVK